MHDLCLTLLSAARAATTLSQPDIDAPMTPAVESLRKSRREKLVVRFQRSMEGSLEVIHYECDGLCFSLDPSFIVCLND